MYLENFTLSKEILLINIKKSQQEYSHNHQVEVQFVSLYFLPCTVSEHSARL